MRLSVSLAGAIICLAVLLNPSCSKRDCFETDCRIEKITGYNRSSVDEPYKATTATFSYNAWGDPTSIIASPLSPGKHHYYFYYDHKHRLTAYVGRYSPDSVVFYTKYFYNSHQMIERDTTYFYGRDINDTGSFMYWSVTKYSYDNQERVSRTETLHSLSQTGIWYVVDYPYDANGNRIWGTPTYDDKVNFLRTHWIFAFINLDYSKNNFGIADTYNARGLPTYQSPESTSRSRLTFLSLTANEIGYSCDRASFEMMGRQ